MIIHIDAFTYEDEWDEAITEAQTDIDNFDNLEEDYETDLEELDEEYYDIIEFEPPRIPTIQEMISDLCRNPQTLFILWLEDEDNGTRKYIMKDTYEHCIGFLEGVRYCGQHTGVNLTPFMNLTDLRPGLLAANTFIDVNNFFDYEVFDK